jgi:conjugative relaxase-like TrwC/TraI family protein
VLTISAPLRSGAVGYYVNYYSNKHVGVWFGSGTGSLGLTGQFSKDKFRSLLLGFAVDGKTALVQNAGDPHRQAGWDLVFNAPKSVSVLWSQSLPETRAAIEQCHRRAVEHALTFIEDRAGLTRRGKGGASLEKAALAFALFQDFTSRALDPHLHTHAVLLNLGCRADGTTGSLWSKKVFELKMQGGALYRVTLAEELSEALRVRIVPDRFGFALEDVPRKVVHEFSNRRGEIEAELKRMKQDSAVAAKEAAVKTRGASPKADLAKLFPAWQAIGRELGWGPMEAKNILQRAARAQSQKRSTQEPFNETLQAATPENSRDVAPQVVIARLKNLTPGKQYTALWSGMDATAKPVISASPFVFTPSEEEWILYYPDGKGFTPDRKTNAPGKWTWTVNVSEYGRFSTELGVLPPTPDQLANLARYEKARENVLNAFAQYWAGLDDGTFHTVLEYRGKIDFDTPLTIAQREFAKASNDMINLKADYEAVKRNPDLPRTFPNRYKFYSNAQYEEQLQIAVSNFLATQQILIPLQEKLGKERPAPDSFAGYIQVAGLSDVDSAFTAHSVSEADLLNGITYRGAALFSFRLYRFLREDKGWTDWSGSGSSVLPHFLGGFVSIQQHSGNEGRLVLGFSVMERDGNWFVTAGNGDKFINGKRTEQTEGAWVCEPPTREFAKLMADGKRSFTRDLYREMGEAVRNDPAMLEQDKIRTMNVVRGRPLIP